jgi:uncharacterized membrane protein HdeD (DUF308 family)
MGFHYQICISIGGIMTESVIGGIKRASGWSIALGVLIILLGIVAMMAPLASGVVVVSILAWTAIFGGVAQIIYAFQAHAGGRTVLEVILGLVMLIAGIYLFTHPLSGLLTLTLLLGLMLVGYGVVAVILALQMRPVKGWGWMLFDAVVTVILGVMIIAHWPINSVWIIGTLFGISILFKGITRLMISLAVRRVASAVA